MGNEIPKDNQNGQPYKTEKTRGMAVTGGDRGGAAGSYPDEGGRFRSFMDRIGGPLIITAGYALFAYMVISVLMRSWH